jgi:hypothetical protein
VQNEIDSNRVPRGADGATIGKTFLHKLVLVGKCTQKTGRPISVKLDANYPCMKGIQVCLNKGPGPHQKIDNKKNANIEYDLVLKNQYSRKLRFT